MPSRIMNSACSLLVKIVLTIFVFLPLIFTGDSLLASAPTASSVRQLGLDDRLVMKSQDCALSLKKQLEATIVVRCVSVGTTNSPEHSQTPNTAIILSTGDKIKVKSNGCMLVVKSATAERIIIRCKAPDWLNYVNYYRTMANLPSVTENPSWDYGNVLHGRYMVKNDFIGHTEDPNNPWYTDQGLAAAQSSDLIVSGSVSMSFLEAVDGWMQAPFHAVGILDPALEQVGYGIYHEADGGFQSGAGLDVIRGLGSAPSGSIYPIMWPANGKTVAITMFRGELPDPLSSCPGFVAPAGLPILLQLGPGNVTPNVTAHSFMQNGALLPHCIFDETNYSNSDSSLQNLGRAILNSRDAIVLIPREPLKTGETYTASITTNGHTHSWSFSVASSATDATKMPLRQIRQVAIPSR